MSTEQHEAPTKRCRCPALAEAYTKLQEKSLTQHALIVQMAEALTEQASFAPHFPCKKQYGNRPTSGTVYAVETHGKGEAHLTVEGFHKAADAIPAATQYLKGPKT